MQQQQSSAYQTGGGVPLTPTTPAGAGSFDASQVMPMPIGMAGVPPMSMYGGVPQPSAQRETAEEAKRRFECECEFVQALCNPHYLNYLAQHGYFKEEYFINYLKYLLYFKRPEYAKTLKFPQCLFFLEALQNAEWREDVASTVNARYMEDQQMLLWQYDRRKRYRLEQFARAKNESENMPAQQ